MGLGVGGQAQIEMNKASFEHRDRERFFVGGKGDNLRVINQKFAAISHVQSEALERRGVQERSDFVGLHEAN